MFGLIALAFSFFVLVKYTDELGIYLTMVIIKCINGRLVPEKYINYYLK